jgi:hypothetical protein
MAHLTSMAVFFLVLLSACTPPGAPNQNEITTQESETGATADFRTATRDLVAFLRGDSEHHAVAMADSIQLVIAPEGGGLRREIRAEDLATRETWVIDGGGRAISIVPSQRDAEVELTVGRHRNCGEFPLETVAEDLADSPHVGVTLYYGRQSCLQTWNATFVYSPDATEPTLIAAVYDQWEW